jgi:hypothetical protein
MFEPPSDHAEDLWTVTKYVLSKRKGGKVHIKHPTISGFTLCTWKYNYTQHFTECRSPLGPSEDTAAPQCEKCSWKEQHWALKLTEGEENGHGSSDSASSSSPRLPAP